MRLKSFQCVHVTSEFWNTIKKDILKTRNRFEKNVFNIIKHNDLSITPKTITVLFLPEVVTKEERHQIHRYSIKNKIDSYSTNVGVDRYMKIIVKPDFFKK